jgi:photosystem II stability/assembly factor-like uncharacterized protein
MTTVKNLILLILTVGILTIPFACKKKKDDPDPEPNSDIIIADETRVLDLNSRNSIINIDTTNFTFTFSGETKLINNLIVGDILVDSASSFAQYGYLRRVTNISSAKGDKIVSTEAAGLTDAVKQGSIDFKTGTLNLNQIKSMELADGVHLKSLKGTDFTVFDFDYDMDFDDLNIKGNTSLDMDVFFKFDWSCDCFAFPPEVKIDTFASGVSLHQSASINITSQGGATIGFDDPISLAKFYFEPWTFSIGPVPVVFVPIVELIMDVDGHVSANFSTGASESFHGKLGIGKGPNLGWKPIKQREFTYDYYPPILELSAGIEAHVGPEISLMLYGVVGPYANVTGCTRLNAEMNTQTELWDMEYIVGSQATVGLKIDVFIFDRTIKEEFCLFEQNLMSLNGEPMENGIFWEYPVNGNWYTLGNDLQLEARTSGATPTEVQFFADGNLLSSAYEEPFEFIWNTSSELHGEHELVVNYLLNQVIIDSDTITISLLNAQWEIVDLSSLGQNNETINYDVLFSDTDHGWITGGTGYGFGGYLLRTDDAGASWNKISPDNFLLSMKEIQFINENEILIRMFDGSLFMAGDWEKEYGYSNDEHWVVTFKDYDLNSLAMSSQGHITAIGRHWSDNRFYLLEANPVTHELISQNIITKYNEDFPRNSEVYFRNRKGIVYNITDEDNPLRQYIMISDNGGVSWSTKILNASGITPEDRIYDAFFADEDLGWLVGKDSQGFAFVIKTEDGCETWEKINVEQASSFGSVNFLSDQEGYATVNTMDYGDNPNYKLYHTLDGGSTWSPIEMVYTKLPMYNVVFQGPYLGYAVGHGPETFRFSVNK